MSKTTDTAIEAVQNSKFIFKNEKHTLFEVWDAVIIWTNFRGEANRFGSTKKNFNLVLTQDVAQDLSKRGWNVKKIDIQDDEGNVRYTIYFVNITVKMDSQYPPVVTLFTEWTNPTTGTTNRNRTALDDYTIGTLDRVIIKSCDLTVNGYENPNIKGKITGYLSKLNVIEEPDIEYGGKYESWLSSENYDEHNAYFDGDLPYDR